MNGISKTLSLNHQTRVRNAIVVSNSAKRTLHHCHQFKPSLFRRILCLRTSNFEIRSIGEEIKTEVPQNRKKEGTETEQTKNSNCNGRKHNEEEEKERLSVSGENKVVIHWLNSDLRKVHELLTNLEPHSLGFHLPSFAFASLSSFFFSSFFYLSLDFFLFLFVGDFILSFALLYSIAANNITILSSISPICFFFLIKLHFFPLVISNFDFNFSLNLFMNLIFQLCLIP